MPARVETPSFATTTLFGDEFRRGRSYANWRPRGSGDWLMIYTVAGAGLLTSRSRQGSTRPGEAILYAPGDLQDYRTDPESARWHLLWVHFVPKPSWHPWLRWPVGTHGVKSLDFKPGEMRENFTAALRRLLDLQKRRLPNGSDLTFNALEESLLWAHLSASRGKWTEIDTRIREAMDYLASDLRRPFRLEELARHGGMSVSRLAHLFKSETGVTPQQFLEQQRMWHAGQLLRLTGLGVAEIAMEVGYEDAFYFSNRFRRYAKKSPSQYRQEKRRA